MGFTNYPYTNFSDLNLDWFLNKFKDIVKDVDGFKDNLPAKIGEVLYQLYKSGQLDPILQNAVNLKQGFELFPHLIGTYDCQRGIQGGFFNGINEIVFYDDSNTALIKKSLTDGAETVLYNVNLGHGNGLVRAGDFIFAVDNDTNTLYKVRYADGQIIGQVAFGSTIHNVAVYDGALLVYGLTLAGDNRVMTFYHYNYNLQQISTPDSITLEQTTLSSYQGSVVKDNKLYILGTLPAHICVVDLLRYDTPTVYKVHRFNDRAFLHGEMEFIDFINGRMVVVSRYRANYGEAAADVNYHAVLNVSEMSLEKGSYIYGPYHSDFPQKYINISIVNDGNAAILPTGTSEKPFSVSQAGTLLCDNVVNYSMTVREALTHPIYLWNRSNVILNCPHACTVKLFNCNNVTINASATVHISAEYSMIKTHTQSGGSFVIDKMSLSTNTSV